MPALRGLLGPVLPPLYHHKLAYTNSHLPSGIASTPTLWCGTLVHVVLNQPLISANAMLAKRPLDSPRQPKVYDMS